MENKNLKDDIKELSSHLGKLYFPKVTDKDKPESVEIIDLDLKRQIRINAVLNILKDLIPGIKEKNRMKLYQLILEINIDKEFYDNFAEADIDYEDKATTDDYNMTCYSVLYSELRDLLSAVLNELGYRNKIYCVLIKRLDMNDYYRFSIELDWSDNKVPFWDKEYY